MKDDKKKEIAPKKQPYQKPVSELTKRELKRELKKIDKQKAKEKRKAEKAKEKAKKARNQEFAIVAYIFVGIFIWMMGYIVYFQISKSPDLVQSPYNARIESFSDFVTRGDITDRNGNILAHTETDFDGNEYRTYPYSNMFSHVVGFNTHGKYGLESVANIKLLTSNSFFLNKLLNEFSNHKNQGDTVCTTLDLTTQMAAYNALGADKGAVVAMDPKTGEILAMVSKPDFEPNYIETDYDTISQGEESVLLNRTVMGSYAPGSTFKLVTALEFMRENSDYSNYTYLCEGGISSGDVTIHCYNGTVHGQVNLEESVAYSCNTSFSNIGSILNVKDFRNTAKELLFNSKLPGPLNVAKSSFALNEDSSEAEKMMTAMGQGKTEVTPYHMALITSAIANDGVLMKPYLVKNIHADNGRIIDKTKAEKYKKLMTKKEAQQLKSYMESVVNYGTASIMAYDSYYAAGKTGTAEYSSDANQDHSWYVGMASMDGRDIVVSVVIEQSDGTTKAVNVAKYIFDAFFYNQVE